MPKTKPRIDKKSAISFRLVHRSQHDPLIADETAPQHVLKEVTSSQKEEQVKYGVYFDDDYDYLKHLKPRGKFEREWEMVEEKRKIDNRLKLPSSVFPSVIEEDEGMLHKAAPVAGPQPDVDPDVVAAMEDGFDLEDPSNQLTDDYLAEILEGGLAEKDDDESSDVEEHGEYQPSYSMARFEKERFVYDDRCEDRSESTESIDSDFEGPSQAGNTNFNRDETKSVFTEYSLTSSVLPRNEGLSLIDEKFEAMFEKEYGTEMDMGALDLDDIQGSVDPNKCLVLKQLVKEEDELKKVNLLSKDDKIKTLILDGDEDTDEENDLIQLEIDRDAGKNHDRLYDCESILSTYSNLYNHPKLIRTERSVSKKLSIDPVTGIVVPPNNGLTKKNLRELDLINSSKGTHDEKSGARSNYSRVSRISEHSERDKNETPDERKARKSAFKELKRERRLEKKANRTAFKLESDSQKRNLVHLRNNMNSMKLV